MMDILIKTTIIYSRNNKYQRGDSFKTDENKGKNSSSRMGWFRASGTVEIRNVRWPFITWWSNEVKVDWWIKLQKLFTFKEKEKKQVLCWYYIQKTKFIIRPAFFDANNIISDPFIQDLKCKTKMVNELSRQMKI